PKPIVPSRPPGPRRQPKSEDAYACLSPLLRWRDLRGGALRKFLQSRTNKHAGQFRPGLLQMRISQAHFGNDLLSLMIGVRGAAACIRKTNGGQGQRSNEAAKSRSSRPEGTARGMRQENCRPLKIADVLCWRRDARFFALPIARRYSR